MTNAKALAQPLEEAQTPARFADWVGLEPTLASEPSLDFAHLGLGDAAVLNCIPQALRGCFEQPEVE